MLIPTKPILTPWRRAMVTGASSGIGEAIAGQLALAGVDLVLIGRNLEALEAVGDRARSIGVQVDVLPLDLSDPSEVDRAVNWLTTATPTVDLLVNNAGLGQWGSFLDLPIGRAIETMRVNCEALVRLTHAAVSKMDEAGHGSVIQISSTAGSSPGPSQAIYAASKAFVTSFGQALTAELAPTAVTCTTVLPGYTRTQFFEKFGRSTDNVPEEAWMSADEVAIASLDAARAGEDTVYARQQLKDRPARRCLALPGRLKRRALSGRSGSALRRLHQALT